MAFQGFLMLSQYHTFVSFDIKLKSFIIKTITNLFPEAKTVVYGIGLFN